MVIFFALAGFVFLITQYFQFLKGYAPFSTGLRILPVATCIAVGSLVGVRLAVGVGNKAVIATGLLLVGVSFAWVSTASTATPYIEIVGQMVLAGLGWLGHRPRHRGDHGCRSQREGRHRFRRQRRHPRARRHPRRRHHRQRLRLLYASGIKTPPHTARTRSIPPANPSALRWPSRTNWAPPAGRCSARPQTAFFDGFQLGCLVAAGVLIAGAAFAARYLPSRPTTTTAPEPQRVRAPALETASAAVAAGLPGCCWDREPATTPATVN
jgi:hypothetical protein